MAESDIKMSVDKQQIKMIPSGKDKPKKRSLVERELETSLTPRLTSPLTNGDSSSTSRYGRARRAKNDADFCDTEKAVANALKSPHFDKSPKVTFQSTSPVYKMQASNSLIHGKTPKVMIENNLKSQIENIYNANISLSRFGSEEKNGLSISPSKKYSKVYMRKDLIQSKEQDESLLLIRNLFSPSRSTHKSNSHLNNILERSSEKYDISSKSQKGYLDTSSVVKTLDFDCGKKKKNGNRVTKASLPDDAILEGKSKNQGRTSDVDNIKKKDNRKAKSITANFDLLDLELKNAYQGIQENLKCDNKNKQEVNNEKKKTPAKSRATPDSKPKSASQGIEENLNCDFNKKKQNVNKEKKRSLGKAKAISALEANSAEKMADKHLNSDNSQNKKRKGDNKELKSTVSKSDLFELEAKSPFQVGDLAWARIGTYPFWPCIITREPGSDMFVKKKLFGNVEHKIIHVTFFGDNGRRSWILDNMLLRFQGLAAFEAARDQMTSEAKKRDPRLHAAFFISDKKLALWHTAIEEAESLQREPKRLRIDLLYELLGYSTLKHTPLKNQKTRITRTDSDVSLSESLYDSLFSEDDGKVDESGHKKNKALDVSEVVTACLDNMAAKTGMTMIQRKSHMDIWLQKAKSQTPEKSQLNVSITVERIEKESQKAESIEKDGLVKSSSKESDRNNKKKKKNLSREVPIKKPYTFRKSTESQNLLFYQNEHDYSKNVESVDNLNTAEGTIPQNCITNDPIVQTENSICVIDNVESLCNLETMIEGQEDLSISEVHEEIVTDNDHCENTTIVINEPTDIDKEQSSSQLPEQQYEERENSRLIEKKIENFPESNTKNSNLTYEKLTNKDNTFAVETELQVAETTTVQSLEKHILPVTITSMSNIDNNMLIDGENRNSIVVLQQEIDIDKSEIIKKNDEAVKEVLDENNFLQIEKDDISKENELQEATTDLNISVDSDATNCETSKDLLDFQDDTQQIVKKIEHIDDTSLQTHKNDEFKENKHHDATSYLILSLDSGATNFENVSKDLPNVQDETQDIDKEIKQVDEDKYLQTQKNDITKENEQHESTSQLITSVNGTSPNVQNNNNHIDKETKQVDENNFSKTQGNNILKECEQYEANTNPNMSIDNEVTSCETSNNLSNIQDDTKDKDFGKEIKLVIKNSSLKIQEVDILKESEEIEANTELNMFVDNDVSSCETSKDLLKVQDNTEAIDKESNPLNDFLQERFGINLSPEPNYSKNRNLVSSQHSSNLTTESSNTSISAIDSRNVCTHKITSSSADPITPKLRSSRKSKKTKQQEHRSMEEPEFLRYVELRQDSIIDEHPDLSQDDIVAYLYKTWQFENNIPQKGARKSKSPSNFLKEATDAGTIAENNLSVIEEDLTKDNTEHKVKKVSRSVSEIKRTTKRSLRLRKSQENIIYKSQGNIILKYLIEPSVSEYKKDNEEPTTNNTVPEVFKEDNNCESDLQNMPVVIEVPNVPSPKIRSLSLHRSCAIAQPIVLIEKRIEIPLTDADPNMALKITRNDSAIKTPVNKLREPIMFESNTDMKLDISQLNSETKSLRTSSRKLRTSVKVNDEKLVNDSIEIVSNNEIKELETKQITTKTADLEVKDAQFNTEAKVFAETSSSLEVQSQSETRLDDTMPVTKDVTSEENEELDVPLFERRSFHRRNTRSALSKVPSKENKETNKSNINNETAIELVKGTSNETSESIIGNQNKIFTSQNESSKFDKKADLEKRSNEKNEIISNDASDNISLSSDFSYSFVDHSSDKDFDPDSVSVSSLSSEISNTVDILPKVTTARSISEKVDVFRKLLESDNESVSSLDDITLNEIKSRFKKEKPIHNLTIGLENSMDSVKSDYSEKRLRLVLTDCIINAKDSILDAKNSILNAEDSKLPVIKEVSDKTDIEFEISQSCSSISPRKLRSSKSQDVSIDEPKVNGFYDSQVTSLEKKEPVEEVGPDPEIIKSSSSETSNKRKGKNRFEHKPMEEPGFLQYLEIRQDALIDEHPEVTPSEIAAYLYKTWQYEESLKSDIKRNDDVEPSNLVKGATQFTQEPPKKKKSKQKIINIEKTMAKSPRKEQIFIPKKIEHRELPKRKASKPFYSEDISDIEDEIEMFEIFKTKQIGPKIESTVTVTAQVKSESDSKDTTVTETANEKVKISERKEEAVIDLETQEDLEEYFDEEEMYFEQLTNPKPNVFKGLLREKVCEICEKSYNLVKCKGCNGMYHAKCALKEDEVVEIAALKRGRKKKPKGRKTKSSLDSNEESQSDEKCQDLNVSEENMSVEEVKDMDPLVINDAETFESHLEAKMKEIIELDKTDYDSYSSDDGIDWADSVAGKCEIVDVKLKTRAPSVNADDFKCRNCQKYSTPVCFVCKSPVSPKNKIERRHKCNVAHCHKYYHLECLEHWPQTQFNAGEPPKNIKKEDEHCEAVVCPRHVCHTCVCDDPRGCKTRFCGDKLARCVRCPATYHSFTKCLPAGSQILSASHIVCPRHYEHRPGKIPYHVNTGWCFICALGGNLICCDYCPTSFHADCLNIEPPAGGYMCEDCETGRLPLYGEMVWVKLGHYRWWPGIILHPAEIPENIMAVKHSPGEFVVRFFGQYDHYWVNRGRVFPFQEGDSGRISTQKSKINEAFIKAMEHAQRAFEILKNVEPNNEEYQDLQSSLLPPHYVKLKVNKPYGALYGKKIDIEESSLTQCECNPDEEDPCGPYSHCLNRMLLTECGPICRAGERCQNRAFEKRQYPKLVPYRTPHRGWGLKTLEPIKAGQFVIEYVGELIDEAEFRRRMQRKHETRDENFYFLTLDKERLIDAGPKGNLARFMNHCCEPNCETQKWTVLGDVRVGLFALIDIPANTEVTFNYNLECTGIEKKQCMCGAKRCAGYIGAKPKQEEPQPKKVKVTAKRTYKKRKNTTESPSTSKANKPKRPVGRPAKQRELTDIEKDLLIIKNATNGISSDSECSGRLSSVDDKDRKETKALKRKRVSFSTEEIVIYNGCSSPSVKRLKLDDDEKNSEVIG